jgi:hypothetical protein
MGRVGRGQGPLISRVTVVEMHSMVALENVKLWSFLLFNLPFFNLQAAVVVLNIEVWKMA